MLVVATHPLPASLGARSCCWAAGAVAEPRRPSPSTRGAARPRDHKSTLSSVGFTSLPSCRPMRAIVHSSHQGSQRWPAEVPSIVPRVTVSFQGLHVEEFTRASGRPPRVVAPLTIARAYRRIFAGDKTGGVYTTQRDRPAPSGIIPNRPEALRGACGW